jgi:hypothetical protein
MTARPPALLGPALLGPALFGHLECGAGVLVWCTSALAVNTDDGPACTGHAHITGTDALAGGAEVPPGTQAPALAAAL